jgi:hypothetical protein
VYIYIYIYIYMREFVSHTVSLVCTHTRTRRGGGAEGWRDKETEGHRGRWADGQRGGGAEGLGGGGTGGWRDWGAEMRNGINLGMFNSCTSVHPCSLAG